MNSKKRLENVSLGKKSDRIPFLPTILEHSAKIIGKTPSQAAQDSKLLEESHSKAYELYHHDAVTVGIDVYNIEAEALGCKVTYHESESIPGISSHPYSEFYGDSIAFDIDRGRISDILQAAVHVKDKIGHKVNIAVGICGPFSITVELAGYEKILMGCLDQSAWVSKLLQKTLVHQKEYCNEIISRGLGITLFESWATPPLITPEIYRQYVMPYEKELITDVKAKGLMAVPLVIGGDTVHIIDDMLSTGTTLLVADFGSDVSYYAKKAEEYGVMLRANIDPKLVVNSNFNVIRKVIDTIIEDVAGYNKFVLGTGVVAYNTKPENILNIRKYLEDLGGISNA